jgi:hypothetical protein
MSLLALLLTAILKPAATFDEVTRVAVGSLTLEVHNASRTAHLFHVIDQVSAWSEFCHAQYGRWWRANYGPFTAKELQLLGHHASIRKRLGWNGGLERTFYVGGDLESALAKGQKSGVLTREDVIAEREAFDYFAPEIEVLMGSQREITAEFAKRILAKKTELRSFADKAARLFGSKPLSVPVYLIANPDDNSCGGGFNGGIIVLEIPGKADAFPTLLHETFHAFIQPRVKDLRAAAENVPGLDEQTLNEGLAYAISPGIVHSGGPGSDPLRDQVSSGYAADKRLEDSYTRFYRFGLALRPLVHESLEDKNQTLEKLLPRAVDAWRVLRELSLGLTQRKLIYSVGPGWEVLNDRTWKLGLHLRSFESGPSAYKSILAQATPGSTVVILYSSGSSIPTDYQDLLPAKMSDVDAAMARGESFERAGTARGFKIVLLAAPTTKALTELVQKTALLETDQ